MNFLEGLEHIYKNERIRLKKWPKNKSVEKGPHDSLRLIIELENQLIIQPYNPKTTELSDDTWVVMSERDEYTINKDFKVNKEDWSQIKYELTEESDSGYKLNRDYLNGYGKYTIDVSWNKKKGIKSYKVTKTFESKDEKIENDKLTEAERSRLYDDFLKLIDEYKSEDYMVYKHGCAYDSDEEEISEGDYKNYFEKEDLAFDHIKNNIKPELDAKNHSQNEKWVLDEEHKRLDLIEGDERYDSYYIREYSPLIDKGVADLFDLLIKESK